MKDPSSYWREQMQLGALLLGKPVSEIPMRLAEAYERKQSQVNEALSALKANPALLASDSGTWRFGSVSTSGFIRGDLTAHIDFGRDGNWTFSGTCWTGPQAIGGGGGGMWYVTPTPDQKMDFHFGAAAITAGEIQVYWAVHGTVVGQLVALVGGAAISGGSGSGKWKKD